jgi:hypothetical protein
VLNPGGTPPSPRVQAVRGITGYNLLNLRCYCWQEWQDSNLQPPVLETGALAIELHSYIKDLAAAEPLMLPSLLPKSVI